jgi:hypothetical protein
MRFQHAMSPCCLDESWSSTPRMAHGARWCAFGRGPAWWPKPAQPGMAENGFGTVGDGGTTGDGSGGALSGLVGSVPERCASEAVARCAWLGQWQTCGL